MGARRAAYLEPPVVFLIEEYYSGLCNGLAEGACSPEAEQATLDRALEEIGQYQDELDQFKTTLE